MKIETELRHTINAAAKAQSKIRVSHQEQTKTVKEAIQALDKKLKGRINKTKTRWDKADAARAKVESELYAFGVDEYLNYIRDDAAFLQSGGIIPVVKDSKWTAEEVISKLAAAKPEQRDEILKEYNIDWS